MNNPDRVKTEPMAAIGTYRMRQSDFVEWQSFCASRGLDASAVVRQAIYFVCSNPAKFADAAAIYLPGDMHRRLKDAELAFGEFDGPTKEEHATTST